MPLPKTVKFKKNGIEYESNFDRTKWTLKELVRAALRDSGKYICRETRKSFYSKNRRMTGKVGRFTQYWVRTRQQTPNLQVGFKPSGFWAGLFELGTSEVARQDNLKNAVMNNVDTIRKIQGQYLSAIEDENRASGLIEEGDMQGE